MRFKFKVGSRVFVKAFARYGDVVDRRKVVGGVTEYYEVRTGVGTTSFTNWFAGDEVARNRTEAAVEVLKGAVWATSWVAAEAA